MTKLNNIKMRVNDAGKLIIVIDPTVKGTMAGSGKSFTLANCRWAELAEFDEALEGMKLNLILSKVLPKNKRAKAAEVNEDKDEAPARGAKRGTAKVKKTRSRLVDLDDADEEELAIAYEAVTENDPEGKTKRRMISALTKAGVEQLKITGDEVEAVMPEEEEVDPEADEEPAEDDVDPDEEVADDDEEPAPRARLGRAAKKNAKVEKPARGAKRGTAKAKATRKAKPDAKAAVKARMRSRR